MKLFNTLSRQIEEVRPLQAPEVSLYTCGPTVYDYPHIGNWFTFIRYDLLVRTLIASGYQPKWVLNITDVGHLTSDADEGEDKLAQKAEREGKTAWDIAEHYINYFMQSMEKLHFTRPWQMPRATDHIPEQIDLIKQLEAGGYTYRISDGIYYDTSKFPKYKEFARLDLDEQQAWARVELNPEKKNPSDFALWKFSPSDLKRDMEWDSPWGKGFPGWHLECSAMILKLLGETIDIHSGGIDHVPVHHTNEIAQSEAVTNKPLAMIWMHTNHILLNDQKISKSIGNTITLEQLAERNIYPETLRLLVIESHYRSQSKFDWDSLDAAQQRLVRYRNFAARRYQPGDELIDPPDLLSALQDDLNTPQALAKLERFLDEAEDKNLTSESIERAVKVIDELFGLDLLSVPDIPKDIKRLIDDREQARARKDWAASDDIRTQLAAKKIALLDRPAKTIWQYLN